jgi:Zn-dependent membrane protease YugP
MDPTIRSFCEQRRVIAMQQDRHYDANHVIGFKTKRVHRHDEQERFRFQQHRTKLVPMVTLRRKTHLFAFLVILCQFAIVDRINFLPLGIILYAVAINVALQLLSDENDALLLFEDDLPEQDRTYEPDQEEEFRRNFEMAKFEYHILKKKPYVKFARVRDRDGRLKLFVV